MRVQRYFFICMLAFAAVVMSSAAEKDSQADSLLLQRVYDYASQIDTTGVAGSHTHAYQRFLINTQRRNFLLLAVPTMYGVAHSGKRQFAGEFYDDVEVLDLGKTSSKHCSNTLRQPSIARQSLTRICCLLFTGKTIASIGISSFILISSTPKSSSRQGLTTRSWYQDVPLWKRRREELCRQICMENLI